jgi:hypothetical protein
LGISGVHFFNGSPHSLYLQCEFFRMGAEMAGAFLHADIILPRCGNEQYQRKTQGKGLPHGRSKVWERVAR